MGLDISDLSRKFKWKFGLDNKSISFRKTFIFCLLFLGIFLYFGPSIYRWIFRSSTNFSDPVSRCLYSRLDPYLKESEEFNSNIKFVPPREDDNTLNILHFVGNGAVGLEIHPDSPIYIKSDKVLSLSVPYQPIVSITPDKGNIEQEKQASVLQFYDGMVQKLQCIPLMSGCVDIVHQFYAHRTIPSLLVQEIKIVNSNDQDIIVTADRNGLSRWFTSVYHNIKIRGHNGDEEFQVISGTIDMKESSKQIAVSIVTSKIPESLEVKSHSSAILEVYTVVTYSTILDRSRHPFLKDQLEKEALADMQNVLSLTSKQLKIKHVDVWHELFSSGLSISPSKAAGALNGDQINATLYLTLSQVRSHLSEYKISRNERESFNSYLAYTEGCYGGHHTLQAEKLWATISTVQDVLRVTSLWLKTLETKGCYKLIRTGAEGVMQAMVLSFGALKFSNQHLEFNTEPKDLHRDFHYRRINYGNATHVNISVTVMDDNKAALYVALDRSDKNYYACDGGCLDAPVQLSQSRTQFPVKMTDPATAVLYITSDKMHMEDLKHTIHVKEVVEAPAHEHHVIALHKHGHRLGGLPAFFWATFSMLIILFHLFLFKLIYNEYCGGTQSEPKVTRTRKFSDL